MSGRKRRPKFDPDLINPAEIVQLTSYVRLIDGTARAALIFHNIPEDRIEEVGRACALAILATLEWPEDKAARLADKVQAFLAERLKRDLDELKNPKPPAAWCPDDDIPF